MKYRHVENAPIAWHVTLRLTEDGWLARKSLELRRAARLIHAQLALVPHSLVRAIEGQARLRTSLGMRVQVLG